MSAPDDCSSLLLDTVNRLNAAGIPYMVAGSYAIVLYGVARATQDVDIVIAPELAQLEDFVADVRSDFYVSAESARAAFARGSLFNVIDTKTGWKIDLIVRKSRPFSSEEFIRRRTVTFRGRTVYVVSPEDSILSKLEWAQRSGSERQLQDAESVAVIGWQSLDHEYLQHWATELGVVAELKAVLDRARLIAQ
jgi:hypothetical protein